MKKRAENFISIDAGNMVNELSKHRPEIHSNEWWSSRSILASRVPTTMKAEKMHFLRLKQYQTNKMKQLLQIQQKISDRFGNRPLRVGFDTLLFQYRDFSSKSQNLICFHSFLDPSRPVIAFQMSLQYD
jgi:hypothetical protein